MAATVQADVARAFIAEVFRAQGLPAGDAGRVGVRKAGGDKHIADEGARDVRPDRRRHHASPSSFSGMSVRIFCLSAAEMFSAFTCRAHSNVPMSYG